MRQDSFGVFASPWERASPSFARLALLTYMAIALACLAWWSGRLALKGDGAQYASMAENMLRGRWAATSLPYYDEHHRLGGLPVPQTVFPPGYPTLVAIVGAAGLPVDRACLLVAVVGHFTGVVALYLVAKEAGHRRWACLSVAATWACFVVDWFNVLQCASEPTFIPLTIAGAWCVLRQRATGRRRWAFLGGILSGCAFSVRYFGMFFAATLLAREAARAASSRRRGAMLDLLASAIGPTVAIALIFGRNYALLGDVRGGNANPANRDLAVDLRESRPLVPCRPGPRPLGLAGLVGDGTDRHRVGGGRDRLGRGQPETDRPCGH